MRSAVWLARTKSGSRPSRHSINDSGLMRKSPQLQGGTHRPCYPNAMSAHYMSDEQFKLVQKTAAQNLTAWRCALTLEYADRHDFDRDAQVRREQPHFETILGGAVVV